MKARALERRQSSAVLAREGQRNPVILRQCRGVSRGAMNTGPTGAWRELCVGL